MRSIFFSSFFLGAVLVQLSEASDDLSISNVGQYNENVGYSEVRENPDYQCTGATSGSLISIGTNKACLVSTDCKYLPKAETNLGARGLQDRKFYKICLPLEGVCPTFDACTRRTENTPYWVGFSDSAIKTEYLADGERDAELGLCKYNVDRKGSLGIFLETEEEFSIGCSGLVTCTGGKKEFFRHLIACGPKDDDFREIERTVDGKKTTVIVPVCPGPASCIKNPLPTETVKTVAPRGSKQKNATPHATSSDKSTKSNRSEATPASGSGGAGKKTH